MADGFANEKKEMQLLTEQYVEKLINIWVTMFDSESCKNNLHKLLSHTKDFYEDLVQESISRRSSLKNDIKELEKEAEELKRMLRVDVQLPQYNTGQVPLLVMQCEMDQRLESLRDLLEAKREEVRNMLLEQETLCEQLGEQQRTLSEDPLPTSNEMEDFRKHLDNLREERIVRLEKVTVMREDIKRFLRILDLKLNTETEDRLLNYQDIKLNRDTFIGLQDMYDCFGEQVKDLTDNINNTRKKLETLWERLNVPQNTREKFRQYVEHNQNTHDILYAELKRCETLKSLNIKKYVLQIREEISEWWDKTLKSEAQRRNFHNFYSNCYSDDLLDLHEMELADLKKYYEKNQQIFELYAARNVLWDRMMALEAKASEPGRYNNRGGQLLKEEKERKTIATKLPKIEQQIHDLVKEYEARENEPFLVYGKNIIIAMATQWEEKRLQKEKLSSARKNATKISSLSKNSTPLAASSLLRRTPVPLGSANSMLNLRKTPSTLNLLTPNRAITTGEKRKLPLLEKGTPLAKRSLMHVFNTPNAFIKPNNSKCVNPSRKKNLLTGTTVTHFKSLHLKNKVIASSARQQRRSGRHSGGSGKKRQSLPKSAKFKEVMPKIVINEYTTDECSTREYNTDDTYNSFEKNLQPYSRSSIIQNQSQHTRIKLNNEYKRLGKQSPDACSDNYSNSKHILKHTSSKLYHTSTVAHMAFDALNRRGRLGPHSPSPASTSRKLTTKNLPIII